MTRYDQLGCLVGVFGSGSAEALWKGASGVQIPGFSCAYGKISLSWLSAFSDERMFIRMTFIIFFVYVGHQLGVFFWCLSRDRSFFQQHATKHVVLNRAQLRSLKLFRLGIRLNKRPLSA